MCNFKRIADFPCHDVAIGVAFKGFECGSFEATLGVKNPRVGAGLSDTLWSLRTVLITPSRSVT